MKKRFIKAIICFLLVIVPMVASAAIGTTAGSGSVCPGNEIDIPIAVTNCDGVSAISLALGYDANKLTYLGYQNPSPHFGSNLHVNAQNGKVYLTWYSLNAVDFGSEILLEIRFEGISGTSSLNWSTSECEYSDVDGNVIASTYSNGSVTVYTLPTVTSQPGNRTVTEGQNTTFSINATGQGIGYQWQVKMAGQDNWTNLSNALPYSNVTTRTMTITNVPINLNGNQYRCRVSGTCEPEAYSNPATLNVIGFLPTITTTAVSATSCPETEFEIPITVTNCSNVGAVSLALNYNTSLVTYLGYQDTNAGLENGLLEINEDNGTVYFSWIAIQSALNIGDAILVNLLFESRSGNSTFNWNTSNCEYSTTTGRVFPAAYNSGTATVYFTPSITSNPSNKTVVEGSNATFSVQASGHGLSYRWQVSSDAGQNWSNVSNGTHYSNATTASLNVVNATLEMDNYRYRCKVSGTCEPVAYSNSAVLHVKPLLPTIVTTLVNTTACQDVDFTADIAVTNFINVGSVSLALNYNASQLTYLGYENLNSALEDGSIFVNELDGVIYISWMSVTGATIDGGIMMSLKFNGIAGNSSLTWNTSRCEYANVQGMVFPHSYQNGTATIYAAPYITTQPSNKAVVEGSSTTVSVSAGGRTLSYRWQGRPDEGSIWTNLNNGAHYSNVTGSTLNILNTTLDMNGSQYRCIVSGECEPEVISNHAKLTVKQLLPTIATRVGPLSTCSGTEFGIPISVTNFINVGAVSLALAYNPDILTYTGYEWVNAHLGNGELHVNAADGVVYVTWMSVEGATIGNGTLLWLNFTGVAGSTALTWRSASCEYSNTEGYPFPTTYSNGSVVVQQEDFEITTHPANKDVIMGDSTVFSVGTEGQNLTYQWCVSEDEGVSWTALEAGELYANVNTDTLLVNTTSFDMNGYLYRCEVNGTCGLKYSNFALLTVGLAEDFHQVSITVVPEDGGEVTGEGVYYVGNSVTLTATKNIGYHFVDWVENDTTVSTDTAYVFSIGEDHYFTAHFELNQYNVSLSGNIGGVGELTGAGVYNYGETCTVSAVANVGFTFVHWTRDGTVVSTEPSFDFTVTEDRNYEAHFIQNSYEILATVLPEESGTIEGSGTYVYGSTCTLTAIANMGYYFYNWTQGGVEVSTDPSYSFVVTEATVYVAHFTQTVINHEILATATPVEGGTITGAGVYIYGSTATLTASANTGYSFVGWVENGQVVSTDIIYSFTVTGDRNLVANFSLSSYEVAATASPSEGGTITGMGVYGYGATATLTAIANTGYTFVSWNENGQVVSTEASYSFIVTGGRTLEAVFSTNSCNITAVANPAEGGVITFEGGYTYGSTITILATANEGYTFVNWTEGGMEVSTDAQYSFTVTGDRNLVANFELNSYEISATASPTTGGSVTGGGVYDYGTMATLVATANTGYTFVGWNENGQTVSTSSTYGFVVTGARTLEAVFTLNSYDITVSANPAEGGTITGAGTYNYGQTCTLSATANEGYTFTNWTKNGEIVSTGASYSFTVTEDAAFVANFAEVQVTYYNISAGSNPSAGGSVTGAGTYISGQTCTLTAIANEGYTFVNWTENGTAVSTDATYSFEVTGARSLVANFAAQGPVTNHWTPIGGTQYNMTMSGIILIDGVEQTVTTLEVGAFCGDECRGSMMPEFFPPTQQYVVSLTVVSNQQSGENITFRLYDHLAQQELDLQCANNIIFESNAIIGTVGDWYQFAFNSEVSVTATVNPEGAGTVTGTGDFMPGTTATLTATANSGYVFRAWTLNGETVSTDNPYTFTVTGATNLVAQFDLQHVSTLPTGWSWWSTYIEMNGNNGLQQLEQSLGHNGLIIKTQTPYVQNYYPSLGYDYWFGSLTNVGLTNEAGYQISVSNACQAIVSGAIADAATHPITVKPGWNWIGYPVATQQGLSTALANFTPASNDLIKGQNTSATYYANYGWFPTSFTLTPGQGYMYLSNATENKTLTYAVSRGDSEIVEAAERIWTNDEHAFAGNLTVMAVVAIDGEEQRSEELELGAFVGGECRGSAVLSYFEPTGRWYAMLTVAGEEGEEINFAVIDRRKGNTNARSTNRVVFVENAVVGNLDQPYEVSFAAADALKAYPNPVGRNESFTLDIPSNETVAEVYVYNVLGEVVSHESGAQAGQRMHGIAVVGVYTVKVVCKSGNAYVGRLIVK